MNNPSIASLQSSQNHNVKMLEKLSCLQCAGLGCYWDFFGHNGRQVDDPLRIAPLVVVPHHDLHQVLAHDHSQSCINGVGVVCLHEVTRHQWLLFEVDDALHFSLSCCLNCCVHILLCALLTNLHHQVNNGHVWCGHPQRDAVQLALVLGQDFSNRLCGTCRGGDNVASTSTSFV